MTENVSNFLLAWTRSYSYDASVAVQAAHPYICHFLVVDRIKEYTAYDRVRENGPYGKIPSKEDPIRTLGFTQGYLAIW